MIMELAYKHCNSKDQLVDQAYQQIVRHMNDEISAHGQASLFLSGGSTPGPVYEALSTVALPWDKVTIGLVDERWVEETDSGSNAALIRRTLLKGPAGEAQFVPMKTSHKTPQAGQETVEAAYRKIVSVNSLAVLGMGTDGHVCSWFPEADGLDAAVDPENKNVVQAITARASKVTGEYLNRMTLTYSAVQSCKSVLLLMTGEEKQNVLERAFERYQSSLPASRLLGLNPARLTIFYAD